MHNFMKQMQKNQFLKKRLALSEVRICRPPTPSLSFVPIFMKETHSAKSNEK